jgi:hypothetical protein
MLARGASLLFPLNSAVHAQTMVDMSMFTCQQLLTGTTDAIEAAVWLSGYYNGLWKNTTIDLNTMKHNAEVVVTACKETPINGNADC